jgi:tyrosyl-tRNA synthetase
MTLLPKSEIEATLAEHMKDVSKRHAQRVLARTVTEFVHGADGLRIAENNKNTLFVKAADEINEDDVAMLERSGLSYKISVGTSLVDALMTSKLASSKREARQFLADGAIVLNGEKVMDRVLSAADFKNGNAILKRGKRNVVVLILK